MDSSGDDILVGDATIYDAVDEALKAIMAEWTSGNKYLTLVGNLRASFFFDGSIDVDPAIDRLTGSSGRDWYLISAGDVITDKKLKEEENKF